MPEPRVYVVSPTPTIAYLSRKCFGVVPSASADGGIALPNNYHAIPRCWRDLVKRRLPSAGSRNHAVQSNQDCYTMSEPIAETHPGPERAGEPAHVLFETTEGVGWITLNRPDQLNTLS